MQLFMIAFFCQTQRVEIGMKMATHAVGPDHHDGAHGIARGVVNLLVCQIDTISGGFFGDLFTNSLGHRGRRNFAPVAIQGRYPLTIGLEGPVGAFPGSTAGIGRNILWRIFQLGKEIFPLRINRIRVGLILGIYLFNIGRIATIQK